MRTRGVICLILLCIFYWLIDSGWSYWSFEINLKKLIFAEPTSYLDTFLLRVSPYQMVSRLMVVAFFLVAGGVIIAFLERRRKMELERQKDQMILSEAEKLAKVGGWEWDTVNDSWSGTVNWREMHGFSSNQLETAVLLAKVIPEDIPLIEEAMTTSVKVGKPYNIEYRIIGPQAGETRHILARGELRVDESGKVVRIIGAAQDITSDKLAEAALKESEERYRRLFEMESDAIFLIENETGRILEANKAASKIYGYSRREFLSMKNTDVSAEPDETMAKTLGEDSVIPLRYHQRKDGEVIPVEITAKHFEWQERKLHIAAIRDISFRLEAEQEKRKLEKLVQQTQKMESIGTLAGGIAHDFNNILASIIGFTELALDDAEPGSSVHASLKEVYASSVRAEELVRQILVFARKSDEELRPIKLSEVVEEVLKIVRPSTPTTVQITYTKESDSYVVGNVSQLNQVVMNLCTNGVQALQHQGGSLEITLKDVLLSEENNRIGLEKLNGRFVELTVADSGPGVDSRIAERIFEPYFTTREVGEGTGLGLAMVRGIVEKCGGDIAVKSLPGEKTSFIVRLPTTASGIDLELLEKKSLSGGSERILLVDDEPALTKMGGQLLERLGYVVTMVRGSIEALEIFKHDPGRFDLVISDMTMPSMTGDMLALELRKIRPDIPVILTTGYSNKLNEEYVKKLEIDAFIFKPFHQKKIAEIIRWVLDTPEKIQAL